MKSKNLLLGILAIALVLAMTAVGCDNGSTDNNDNNNNTQSVTYQSAGSDGNTYILTITKNTARYVAKEGDSYVLTIKKAGQPDDKVSRGIVSKIDKGVLTLQPNNSGSEPFTVTVTDNGQMTDIKGTITVEDEEGTTVTAPEQVTPQENDPLDNKPIKDRWGTWLADDATAKLVYSVDNDGVCTLTVSGIAQPNDQTDGWGRWKANAHYEYTATAGKSYTYTFEAWTQSGTRVVNFEYCNAYVNNIQLSEEVSLTNTRQTYTVYGQAIAKGALNQLDIHCADQLGTFYVKILEIREYAGHPDQLAIGEMASWLSAQPANTPAAAYTYKLNIVDKNFVLKARDVLNNNKTKYVKLDLSGSNITKIPDNAFSKFNEDAGAFEECITLVGITIPNSVTGIGFAAFRFCTNLTSITIPNSVTNIEAHAFYGCTNLASVTIPNSVTGIGDYAFSDCTSLTGITIPNSVTSIEFFVFRSCTSLTGITIPDSVTSIEWGTFYDCTSLTGITIPDSVTGIDGVAFWNCTSLTSVTFQGTIAANNLGGVNSDGLSLSPFDGDLLEKYLAGGKGTYTRLNDGYTWTKQ